VVAIYKESGKTWIRIFMRRKGMGLLSARTR